jgi:hypothetical protein
MCLRSRRCRLFEHGSDQAKSWTAPTDWKGSDRNHGDSEVEQSNDAETTVIAENKNDTGQSIDQDQTAGDDRGGCGKCGTEGGSQSQTAENNNTTNQNAAPSAETNQSNEIGSDQAKSSTAPTDWKGSDRNHGDEVEQSNVPSHTSPTDGGWMSERR